jgi:hypothetical protein
MVSRIASGPMLTTTFLRGLFLVELKGHLEGVSVEVRDIELEARLIDRLPVRRDGEAHFGVGNPPGANGDFQLGTSFRQTR